MDVDMDIGRMWFPSSDICNIVRERFKIKKLKKKLTNVSFMYVCVAGNGEMLVFFLRFFPQQ